MAIVPVSNVGKIGVVKDLDANRLPPEAWSDIKNFHMKNGVAIKAKGTQAVYDPPSISPYGLLFVEGATNVYWIYEGLAAVYVVDAETGTHTDITRTTGGAYGADADIGWNGGVLGGIPILNNGVDAPQMWTVNPATPLTSLTNWPASTTAKCIRAFKQFLVAMDITEGGTRYPYLIRVSDVADPGTVPGSWDYTDPSTLSIRRPLAEGEDFVIDGLGLKDVFYIYKEHSIWGMSFVGGQSIWRTFPVFRNFGIMSRNCVVEIPGGRHLVATDSYDLRIHNGNTDESILESRMQAWLASVIDPSYYQRSFLTTNPLENEAYFAFVTTGYSTPNKLLVWNWKENTVGMQDIDGFSCGAYGFVSSGDGATIDELTMNIDDMDFAIDSGIESRFSRRLIFGKPDAVSPKLY